MNLRPLSPGGSTVPSAAPTARQPVTQPIADDIDRLSGMRDLYASLGCASKTKDIDAILTQRRRQLAEAEKGPRHFQPDEAHAFHTFLTSNGDAVPPEISADLVAPLRQFRTVVRSGVEITDAHWQTMLPADAFERLMEVPWHGPEQQLLYRTYEDHKIVLSTLRPEHLPALALYVEGTRNGLTFHGPDHAPIHSPNEFVRLYEKDPGAALVRAVDGAIVPMDEARRREIEIAHRLMVLDEMPQTLAQRVNDLGDSISINGIVLKKRS